MGSIIRSGGIYRDRYMVGDWTELVAVYGGADYPIGSTKATSLAITWKVTAHRSAANLGPVDMVIRYMIGMEVQGRLEEVHKENIRLLLNRMSESANQVDHGAELSATDCFTLYGRRPNAEGTYTTAVEFCMWKCRSVDIVRIAEDAGTSVRFRIVGMNDAIGKYGGDNDKPYGWIFTGGQEVTPVTCTWTAIPSSIIPSVDDLYDEGTALKRWRRHYLSQYQSFGTINPASIVPPNGSVYVDTADGLLYYKDGVGVTYNITQPLAPIAAPATYDADTTTNYPAGLPDGTTDSIDIAAPSSGDEFTEGMVAKVTLVDADALGGGDVRVRLYNDQARTDCIFDQYFDLAATPLTAVIPAHFMSDGIAGDAALYADVTNLTGTAADFQLQVRVAGILTGSMSWGGGGTGVGAASARDGIGWDGTGLYLDVLTNGGLGLQGITPNKKAYVIQGRGISVGATVALDTSVAMLLDEAQSNIVMKRFAAGTIGLSPHGSTFGPPAGTGWQKGDLFVDANLLLWRCTDGGPPCVWQFFGTTLEENIDSQISAGEDNATYTGTVTCGSSVDLDISVSANYGYIQKLCIWAAKPLWASGDFNQPFHITCYPNINRSPREIIWSQPGQFRQVTLAAGMTGGVDNVAQVTDIDLGAEDDLLRLRKLDATDAEEYARVDTRDTSAIAFNLGDDVLNTFLVGDPVMFVTEIVMMPFYNNDPSNPRTLFLTVHNDGTAGTDVDVIVGYQANYQYLGGGAS